METQSNTQRLETPPSKRARRWWLALGVVGLALAGWWFGVELPERRAAAELKRQQAERSFRIADLGLDMVWIPPGTFLMGTPERKFWSRLIDYARWKAPNDPFDEPSPSPFLPPAPSYSDHERPVTRVMLTRPFWLGRTEVTQAQWTTVMGSNPSSFKGDDLPVENVSWDDAMEFCRKLTDRERAAGRLPKGHAYRLPTEAQWEYACRAGTTSDFAGDLNAMAWYHTNSGGMTHPVGTKQANAWGLQDMHGNVGECCLDWYAAAYPGGEVTNPRGPPSGVQHIVRGGMWSGVADSARSAFRVANFPGDRLNFVGFRLALAPAIVVPPPPAASVGKN